MSALSRSLSRSPIQLGDQGQSTLRALPFFLALFRAFQNSGGHFSVYLFSTAR
ncbi:hypothetical protein PALB_15550 [Pseudoalteromonas luteoviolacea B = ATCC 29581]|nr:hypothetical protein PALB_15550 [Pseudoalteromonas luteoviolacea B = ATCC 29581]